MAARRFRRGPHTEYIISLDAEDLSQGSNSYMGKLRWGSIGYQSSPESSCISSTYELVLKVMCSGAIRWHMTRDF